MSEDNNNRDLEEELDRLEVETGIDATLNPDTPADETSLEVEDVEIVKLAAADEPVGTEQKTRLENGVHKNITVTRYRECPNCSYQPQHPRDDYEDPPEIKAACAECRTRTCSVCHTVCETCGKPLCSKHRDGFSDREITLCQQHADEKRQERQFEAEVTAAEQRRKNAELKLRYRLKQAKLRLEQQMQQHQQYMEKVQTLLDHLHRQNQLELQRWQTQLEHELKRRKQMLAEYKTAAEIDLKRQKQELERKQHDDEIALKQRQQSLKEQSEFYQQQLKREKHRLNKVSELVSVAQELDGMDNQRMKKQLAKATKKLSQSDLPEVAPQVTV